MPTTSRNGFRYPAGSDAPDGPGAVYNLATDIDNTFYTGTWTPSIGGTGSTIGSGATVTGYYFRAGNHITAKGAIVFGTGASFGNGDPVIQGWPIGALNILTGGSHGTGRVGNTIIFLSANPTTMALRVVVSTASGSPVNAAAGVIPDAPTQGTQFRFSADLTIG